MLPPLQFELLGTFHLHTGGTSITAFHSAKVRALLAYLVVESDRPHERELLAELLWPDTTTDRALTLLRQALHRLNQSLEPARYDEPVLLVTRYSLQFNPRVPFSLDVADFSRAIAATDTHSHRRLSSCKACITKLREAVGFYRGEFLAGFTGLESLPFDEWMRGWRERLKHRMIFALRHLAAHHTQRSEYERAVEHLWRWIELEPWHEEANRLLIQVLAQSGQRGAALAHYDRYCNTLKSALNEPPAPEVVETIRRVRTGEPPGPTPAREPIVLPATPLIGREAELAQIAGRLASQDCRMLTLVGAGGSGKTRLAQEAAATEQTCFADGAVFLALAAIAPYESLAAELARGLRIPTGEGPTEQQLLNYLREKELLLVLDNFEHLAEHAGLLAWLLHNAPQLTILVTSRVPLRVEAESVLHIDGLAFPPTDPTTPAERTGRNELHWLHSLAGEPDQFAAEGQALKAYPAVQLFLHTARRVSPGFAPDQKELHAVVRICRTVDGSPLAINLAAVRVARQSPSVIAEALAHDVGLLQSPLRDWPERHRSIRAVFRWSWDLLTPAEQHTLAYCTVFHGTFTSHAAEAVCALQTSSVSIVDLLDSLVEQSLVRRTETGRYELHELMRRLAGEQLHTIAPDRRAIQRAQQRHSAFYLGLLAQHADFATGPDVRRVAALLDSEIDNIRPAWRWAIAGGDLPALSGSARGLADWYVLSGMYVEGANVFGQAAERVRAMQGDVVRAPLAGAVLGDLLVAQARMLYALGEYQRLASVASEARDLARAAVHERLEAATLIELGRGLWRQGDTPQALAQLQQALLLAQRAGTTSACLRVQAEASYYLGLVTWSRGSFGEAQAYYTAALRLSRAIGYSYCEADALNNLALTAVLQGAYNEAAQHATEALTIYRATGNLGGEGLGLFSLGLTHMYQGEYIYARQALGQCLAIHQRTGDRHNTGIAHALLGMLFTRLGQYEAADAAVTAGLAIGREIDHAWGLAIALLSRGLLAYVRGDVHAGLVASREALAIAERMHDPVVIAYACTYTGHTLAALGDHAAAGAAYQRAADLRHALGQRQLAAEPLAGLARSALAGGDLPRAVAFVEEILATSTAVGLDGPDEPSRVRLTCYQVLDAVADPRAPALLDEAYQRVQAQAAQFFDETTRHAFLHTIANRELVQVWESRRARVTG